MWKLIENEMILCDNTSVILMKNWRKSTLRCVKSTEAVDIYDQGES